MLRIAVVDPEDAFVARLRAEVWPVDVQIRMASVEGFAGDLIVWNLTRHPEPIVPLLARLRAGDPRRGVLFVWDAPEDARGALAAIRAGALDALTKSDGHDAIAGAIRRFCLERQLVSSDQQLVANLVERAYAASILNELLKRINRSQSFEALRLNVPEPLIELTGARLVELHLLYEGAGPDFLAEGLPETLMLDLITQAKAAGEPQWAPCGAEQVGIFPLGEPPNVAGFLLMALSRPLFEQVDAFQDLIEALCGQVALAASNLAHLERARQAAARDGLTGLYNHATFQRQLRAELDRAQRYGRGFSLVMLDVDHFKRINDTHGHLAGDQVLMAIGELLSRSVRISDLAARYGGEEFVILLPDTDAQGAWVFAERLRRAIPELQIKDEGQQVLGGITASFGIASFAAVDGDPREILRRADGALYEAKHGGRNRIVSAAISAPAEPSGPFDGRAERILIVPADAAQRLTPPHPAPPHPAPTAWTAAGASLSNSVGEGMDQENSLGAGS